MYKSNTILENSMNKSLTILLVLALSLTFVQPVSAADYNLNIHNNTEGNVKLKLEGPENYAFTVEPGKIYKTVEEGTYDYNYTSCGEAHSGKITVNDDDQWLVIEKCPADVFHAKFVIDSHFDETLTVTMVGPETYELAVSLGSNRFLTIASGQYSYSYEACGSTLGGEVFVTKRGDARIMLKSCEVQELLAFGLPNPHNLMMGNHFAFPITVTLRGPQTYYVQLQPGFNRIDAIRGDYTYFFVAYNHNYSGSLRVTGGATWVAFNP
jgi:hypothetical protein